MFSMFVHYSVIMLHGIITLAHLLYQSTNNLYFQSCVLGPSF